MHMLVFLSNAYAGVFKVSYIGEELHLNTYMLVFFSLSFPFYLFTNQNLEPIFMHSHGYVVMVEYEIFIFISCIDSFVLRLRIEDFM